MQRDIQECFREHWKNSVSPSMGEYYTLSDKKPNQQKNQTDKKKEQSEPSADNNRVKKKSVGEWISFEP